MNGNHLTADMGNALDRQHPASPYFDGDETIFECAVCGHTGSDVEIEYIKDVSKNLCHPCQFELLKDLIDTAPDSATIKYLKLEVSCPE